MCQQLWYELGWNLNMFLLFRDSLEPSYKGLKFTTKKFVKFKTPCLPVLLVRNGNFGQKCKDDKFLQVPWLFEFCRTGREMKVC